MQRVQKLKYVLACHIIELALLQFQKINQFCELFPLLKIGVWDDCQRKRKDIDDIRQLSNNTIYRHMHVYTVNFMILERSITVTKSRAYMYTYKGIIYCRNCCCNCKSD